MSEQNTNKEYKLKLVVEVTATAPDVHAPKAMLAAYGRGAAGNGETISIGIDSVHVSEKKTRKKVPVEEPESEAQK